MPRKKKVENMKPGEYFIYLVQEKTTKEFKLESRYVQAAKLWKAEHKCAIPYKDFNAFKHMYYKNFKK